MPQIVTHFTNKLKHADKENKRLKPAAFIHPKSKGEISVVDIDSEILQENADELIFNIGDLIYTGDSKVKARGDMNTYDIEAINYGNDNDMKCFLEHAPTPTIPKHYNIKPLFEDLEFANICSYNLSRISKLVIK